jgi:hypothetical protein
MTMPRKTIQVETMTRLTTLCDEAADQMALAHKALHESPEKAAAAIAYMGAALDCLKRCEAGR